MLERLLDAAAEIHEQDPDEVSRLYLLAMDFIQQSAYAFEGALDEESTEQVRIRLHDIAEAAQVLAYEFYHHHERPIADGAIDPESFDYTYTPQGGELPHLSYKELRPHLILYLKTYLPHTLPFEMR
ncbi:hypothetical protein ACC689_20695 [Rhizobium ruizarguesonis]